MSKIKLMSHLVAGYPTEELSFAAASAMVRGGASILEIQLAFSDPSADGPAIQGACTEVLSHNYKVKDPKALAATVREAFRLARHGRPGPVLVDIPRDILLNPAPFYADETPVKEPGTPDADFKICVAEAAEVICQAKQPVIISGGGVINAGASREVVAFAEHYNLPVVFTLMGIGGVPSEHPNVLGFAGMHGTKAANNAVANADLIISLGSRFADRQTGNLDKYTVGTKFIHVDIDPA